MTTPSRRGAAVYSRTIIPMHAIEQGAASAYLDALLAMHFKCLGFT